MLPFQSYSLRLPQPAIIQSTQLMSIKLFDYLNIIWFTSCWHCFKEISSSSMLDICSKSNSNYTCRWSHYGHILGGARFCLILLRSLLLRSLRVDDCLRVYTSLRLMSIGHCITLALNLNFLFTAMISQ